MTARPTKHAEPTRSVTAPAATTAVVVRPKPGDGNNPPRIDPDWDAGSFGDRFRLVRHLGQGAMGLVWEVEDLARDGLRLALKKLQHVTPEGLLLFKSEFRAFRDVRHPNIVALDELFELGGSWFFTMECVDGVAFDRYVLAELPDRVVGPAPQRLELCEQRLRHGLVGLSEGIAAIHRAGMVHRDIKPSNILVDTAGRVVILDFGVFATIQDQAYQHVVGTAAYMAPEQAQGEAPTPAADWYAFGVVLYRALTGGLLPFSGRDAIHHKQCCPAPRPEHPHQTLPRDLVDLCEQLLQRDPSRRPQTEAIFQALGAEIRSPGPTFKSRNSFDPFVGRRTELGQLRHAAGAADHHEHLRTVVVRGQSGVGKSRLVKVFLGDVSREHPNQTIVLEGKCHEREAVPYKAFDGVVDGLARYLLQNDCTLEECLGTDSSAAIAALLQLFPSLGANTSRPAFRSTSDSTGNHGESQEATVISSAFASLVPQPTRELFKVERPAGDTDSRRLGFVTLAALLRSVSSSRRLIIAVDDIQWADDDSIALLAALTQQPLRGLLVLTARETDAAKRSLKSIQNPREVIELRGLSAQETVELARALRPAGDTDPDSSELLQRIWKESGGHPMFVHELIQHRFATANNGSALDLDSALRTRVASFDALAQLLLRYVAVAGYPVPHAAIADATRLSADNYRRHLDALSHAHLVRTVGMRQTDTIAPYHDRVREAVYDALDPEQRRHCHSTLALALEKVEGVPSEVLAYHALEGGDANKAAAHFLTGAKAAQDVLAFARAADLYRRSLELGQLSINERAKILEAQARAYQYAGMARGAAQAYSDAAALQQGIYATDLRRRSAEQRLMGGEVRQGKIEANAVLAPFGTALPATEFETIVRLAYKIGVILASRLRVPSRGRPECSERTVVAIDMSWSIGAGLSMIDTVTGMYFALDGFIRSVRVGEAFRIARSGCTGSVVFSALEWKRSSRRSRAASERAAQLCGGDHADAYVEIARTADRFLLEQDWAGAEERARSALAAWKRAGMGRGFEFDFSTLFATWCRAMRGRIVDGRQEVDALVGEARLAGNRFLEVSLRVYHHLPALADGDPQWVRDDVADALRTWQDDADAFQLPHCWALLSRRTALLYAGRFDEDPLDHHLWARLRRSALWMVGYVRDQARAVAGRWALAHWFDAQRRSAFSEAKQHRKRALRLGSRLAKNPKPVTQAWGRMILAAHHAAIGREHRAASELEAAISAFDATDSRLVAAAGRWRLATLVGGDRGREHRATALDYAERERIVDFDSMFNALAPWPGTPTALATEDEEPDAHPSTPKRAQTRGDDWLELR